ncbi:uncharacterized protein LOC106174721 [Lingula anatina]|uniref:Uncharacterized protein LOC106174721 n=1 Tax=Lingula anatina TaxID=7574 RepID=A0A1S3JN93_LINAN|nr:uncharacterized protein LOC106174721 [Lingula anatina]|eukprot:XP_013411847.1 uncharacterized protein LOC106174721 [Lingula anatina]
MASSSGESEPLVSVDEEKELVDYGAASQTPPPVRVVNSTYRGGYEYRKHRHHSDPDGGTVLEKIKQYMPAVHAQRGIFPPDNPTTVSLNKCKQQVLKPYLWILSLIGWRPIVLTYEGSKWVDAVNVVYFVCVMFFIFMGYVISFLACFRRDRGPPVVPVPNLGNETKHGNYSDCQHYMISQFIIPDILHEIAYFYAWYIIRIAKSEQLEMLMEKAFLQSEMQHTGLSQTRLVKTLRWFLWLGFLWLVLSFLDQVLHVISLYLSESDGGYLKVHFWVGDPGTDAGRGILMCLMVIGNTVLDCVYVAVVINYSVQCSLVIYLLQGLCQKIKEKIVDFEQAMKEVMDLEENLHILNRSMGTAVSILMFNFITLIILGFEGILTKESTDNWLSVTVTLLATCLWLSIMALPVAQACRVSAWCRTLRKSGHEVRSRPFVYSRTDREELDSFLMFTSTLDMRAKMFGIPVKASYVFGIVVLIALILLLLFQIGVFSVWL